MSAQSIEAYARSKGMKLIEAFFDCYKRFHVLTVISDQHRLAIANDFYEYKRTYKSPPYVKAILEYERQKEVEYHARASPAVLLIEIP